MEDGVRTILGGAIVGAGAALVLEGSSYALDMVGIDGGTPKSFGAVFALAGTIFGQIAASATVLSGHGRLIGVKSRPRNEEIALGIAGIGFGVPLAWYSFFGMLDLLAPSEFMPHRWHFAVPKSRTWLKPGQIFPIGVEVDEVVAGPATKKTNIVALAREKGFLVLETGSPTCPIFCIRSQGMDALAAELSGQATFATLYGSEAHPCGRPASVIDSDSSGPLSAAPEVERRLARIREMQRFIHSDRRLLLDGPEGTVQRLFGGKPNAVMILDASGTVRYLSAWNKPEETRKALYNLISPSSPPPPTPDSFPSSELRMPAILSRLYESSGLVGVLDLFIVLSQNSVGTFLGIRPPDENPDLKL